MTGRGQRVVCAERTTPTGESIGLFRTHFQPAVPIRIISLNSIGRTSVLGPMPAAATVNIFPTASLALGARFAVIVRGHLLG